MITFGYANGGEGGYANGGEGGYAPYLVELEKEIWLKNNILKWDWFKFWRLHETHEQSTATP